MEGDSFNLSWTDFTSSAGEAFKKLLVDTSLADVTLVCDDDKQIEAHKVILGSFSEFFQKIFLKNPHQHPLIYLSGVTYTQLQSLLRFIYRGETEVEKEDLKDFMNIAKKLQIEGLIDQPTNDPEPDLEITDLSVHQNEVEIKKEPASHLNNGNKAKNFEGKPNQEEPCSLNKVKKLTSNNCLSRQIEVKFIADEIEPADKVVEETYDNPEKDADQSKMQCEHCNKIFTQIGSLKRHIKTLHEGKRYHCTNCNISRSSKQNLEIHSVKCNARSF